MNKSFRHVTFRLLPVTRSRGKQLQHLASSCRWVWNHFLAWHQFEYRFDQQFEDTYGFRPDRHAQPASFFAMGKVFIQLRQRRTWLQDHSCAILRYTLKLQADAWRAYFKGQRGKPKFKRFDADNDGFTIPDRVRIQDEQLHIPKIGWCRLRRRGGHPYPDSQPKQARVYRKHGKWYASISYEIEEPERLDDHRIIGVDMNVGQVATSEGEFFRKERAIRLEARKKRYQRRLARQQKGSGRRNKTKRKLRKTTAKLANQRHRWAHDTSKRISGRAYTVAVEDLNVKAMTKSAKGTLDKPGRRIKQKAGLNREILKTNWGQLRRMLDYKAGRLVAVNPRYTSQQCFACGHVDKDNRRTQADFKCIQCGYECNADVNAAQNIRASATGASGRGRVEPSGCPMIRQHDPGLYPV